MDEPFDRAGTAPPQRGTSGRQFRDHRALGLPIHLFVRQEPKTRGRAAPFRYHGAFEFLARMCRSPRDRAAAPPGERAGTQSRCVEVLDS